MLLIPRQLTSVSAFFGGQSSAVQKAGSRFIRFLMLLHRFRLTSTSLMPIFMILRRWRIFRTNPTPTISSTEATLTWLDFIKSISSTLTLSSVRKASFSIRSLQEKTLSTVLKELSAIRLSNLPDISPERNILADFAESYTTPKNSEALLFMLPLRSISTRKMLPCFTKNVGKWSCFSNGLSSICTSNPFGAILKTQSEYKYIVRYPLTALLLSPNMTTVSTGVCSMYSAYCEALSLTELLSENCLKDHSTKDLKYMTKLVFNLDLIFSRH